MRRAIATAIILAGAGTAAPAQQTVTIQSLLAQDFTVVGAITSPIGPGVLLQKKDKLFLCFASETPTSAVVATRYCKPVE
jgi:hypothetical protein